MVSEFLGHADPETTLIYAYADTEMKRQAIENASSTIGIGNTIPIWKDQDILEKLLSY